MLGVAHGEQAQPRTKVRTASGADLASIVSFAVGESGSPYWRGIGYLTGPQVAADPKAVVAVRESKPRAEIIGYAIWRPRAECLVLMDLCVRPDLRRQGIGRLLLRHVADQLRPCGNGQRWLIADVFERDLRTQLFLRANGWVCRAILEGEFKRVKECYYEFIYGPETGERGSRC